MVTPVGCFSFTALGADEDTERPQRVILKTTSLFNIMTSGLSTVYLFYLYHFFHITQYNNNYGKNIKINIT